MPARVHPGGTIGGRIIAALGQRYRDVVCSIYIYNEHRGYTALDRVLEAARARCPGETAFIAAVEKHRADERKHYLMFKRWFELKHRMPLATGRSCGHIDHFIRRTFGCRIDDLNTQAVIADADLFERLCRVIMLTEQRGLVQVDQLLENRLIRADPALLRIFEVVHKDEPDHFLPYQHWLERQASPMRRRREQAIDWAIHKFLLLVKLPALFFNPRARRLAVWPDSVS